MPNKYTIIDKINKGLLVMDTASMPSALDLFNNLYRLDTGKIDWEAATEWLDCPEKTIRRWSLTGKFPPMAHKLMMIKFRGFLPFTNKWKHCRFDDDENIVTPYGVCKSSDIAFIHADKRTIDQQRAEIKRLSHLGNTIYIKQLKEDINDKIKELGDLVSGTQ